MDGETLDATLRGRHKHGSGPRVLVGDQVLLQLHGSGSATIEEVADRHSVLKRRTPGKRRGVRIVAANVDQVVVVGAAEHPRWDSHLMDRFVVVAEANQLTAIVVVNKSDLVPEAAGLAEPYRAAGYDVIVTSVPEARGIDELRDRLATHVSLFAGPTGVGKSSLLNAIEPGLRLRTGPVSKKSRSGRHTTVAAEMHPLKEGGFVVDTPGLRDVGLWAVDPLEVSAAFPELKRYASECRFDNCRHMTEPGCAVADAAGRGEISSTRVESYRKLLAEAAEAASQW